MGGRPSDNHVFGEPSTAFSGGVCTKQKEKEKNLLQTPPKTPKTAPHASNQYRSIISLQLAVPDVDMCLIAALVTSYAAPPTW